MIILQHHCHRHHHCHCRHHHHLHHCRYRRRHPCYHHNAMYRSQFSIQSPIISQNKRNLTKKLKNLNKITTGDFFRSEYIAQKNYKSGIQMFHKLNKTYQKSRNGRRTRINRLDEGGGGGGRN